MAKRNYEKPLVYVQKQDSPNIKKEYKKPRADIYQSKDLQKSQSQYRKGKRSYRPTPRFGGTVFGLVSLILLFGIIATVFLSVQNIGRPANTPFVYFSPQIFLRNISSDSVVIDGGSYYVEYELEKAWYQIDGIYWGYITVDGKRIKSATGINEFNINNLEQKMLFVIDRVQYWTIQSEIQGPGLTGIVVARKVELPDLNLEWGNPPDLDDLLDSWEDLSDIGGIANALGETAYFVHDWLKYQSNLLFALLPWNSVASSDDVPADGVVIDIPWRDVDNNIISGVQ